MPEQKKLQRAIRTPILLYEKPVEEPFLPTPEPRFTPEQARYLNEVIPEPWPLPPPRIPSKPTLVEEQYAPTERMVLVTSTTEAHYDIKTADPKQILLIAEDQDHLVEFDRSVDDLSTKIFASGSLAMTGKGVRRIYAKTTTGTGKLYIRIWGP
jgi:hypothetical protein